MKLENKYSVISKISSFSFVKLIIGIDVFVILCTLIRRDFPQLLNSVFLGWIIPKFDLAAEMNFAAWWSSILLFLIGFLAYQQFLSEEEDTRKGWLGIAIIFMGLSIDEISSLHERIDHWLSLAPYALVCLIILTYSLRKLFRKKESRYAAILILAVFVIFSFVALQEYLEHIINWPTWALGLRTIFEEGTELLGSLIGLIGVVSYPNRNPMRQLKNLIPEASTIKRCNNSLFIFLVIHSFLSMTIFSWGNLKSSGNPFVWYPMIVYFSVFIFLLQKLLKGSTENYFLSLILSAIFLLCSALIPYVFSSSFVLSFSLKKSVFGASFLLSFYAFQFFMCVLLLLNRLDSQILARILVILIFIGNLIGLIYFSNLILVVIIIGFNSYIYYYLMTVIGLSIQSEVEAISEP